MHGANYDDGEKWYISYNFIEMEQTDRKKKSSRNRTIDEQGTP